MLEYIFFDRRPWQKFIDFLREMDLQPLSAEEDQGFMVRIPEETDDQLMEAIEAYYDDMLDMNEALFAAEANSDEHHHVAGVSVHLDDGRTVQAEVSPALLSRMLEVLSTDELGQFVNAIVDAVEHPDTRSICRR